ncbi:MAG: DUF1415 family protein, partial [Burkholderiaceae bacterium]
QLGLTGEIQVASFHPDYQFAGTSPDDIENYTNRAPYPTLHLLRESSVERAVEAFPEAAEIFERNVRTLRALKRDDLADHGFAPAVPTQERALRAESAAEEIRQFEENSPPRNRS